MAINMLKNSSYYHVELLSPWSDDNIYDLYVIGQASKKTIKQIDSTVDIRATYFTNYSLGLSSYLNAIKDDTPIYICYKVSSINPINVTTTKLYIPGSLINYNSTYTYEYNVSKKPIVSLTLSPRYFSKNIDANTFAENVKSVINDSLKKTELLINDTITQTYSTEDVLLTDGYISDFESERVALFAEAKDAIIQDKIAYEQKRRDLYEKQVAAEKAISDAATEKAAYAKAIADLATEQFNITTEGTVLASCKSVMIEMIAEIKAGTISITDLPTFDEIYAKVKASM